MNDVNKLYKFWSENPHFSDEIRNELILIKDDKEAITERFYKNLEFGTGGLRGIIGAGTNRINVYTVARVSEGFARYLDSDKYSSRERKVVISYDSRLYSKEFAMTAALIFATHGIKVLFSDEIRPTPMLSYSVRHFGAIGGVMITASHNPAKYNGYKVYGDDGAQLPPDASSSVLEFMDTITDVSEIAWISYEEAVAKGLFIYYGAEIDNKYTEMLKALSLNPEVILNNSDLKIVFTPLNGTGNKPVRRILREIGFTDVHVVPEQELPDPNFTTVAFPNPEERSALKMSIDLAESINADIVVATDPDGDRTGLAVRDPAGDFVILSGNQIGLLLMEYILSAKMRAGLLTPKSFVVSTVVSTKMTRKIAKFYGIKLFEVLTGFKFIAEIIKEYDENGDMTFEFGFEESFGYLAGRDVRDKDGIVSIMLIAEMAAYARSKSMTVFDMLQKLYEKYGYAEEKTISITIEGKEGLEKIRGAMTTLRNMKPEELNIPGIEYIADYLRLVITDARTGQTEPIVMDKSDVLIYGIGDDDWFCARPSGTEPKLKIYFGIYGHDKVLCERRIATVIAQVESLIRELLNNA